MKKNNFHYFKRAFLTSLPIAVFVIVRNFYDIGLIDFSEIMKTIIKGISVGLITGLFLGILNMFSKVEIPLKKD